MKLAANSQADELYPSDLQILFQPGKLPFPPRTVLRSMDVVMREVTWPGFHTQKRSRVFWGHVERGA